MPSVETLRYGSAIEQEGDLWLPEGDGLHPVIVLIHGGFWRLARHRKSLDENARTLANQGWAVWNVDYRAVGSGGGWPGTFEDIASSIDSLQKIAKAKSLDLNSVVAVGHSAGGQLALWAGARAKLPAEIPGANPKVQLRAVVSLAGVIDLLDAASCNLGDGAALDLIGGSPKLFPLRYQWTSPPQLIPLGIPQLVVHGSKDDVVPPRMSENYVRAARAAGDAVTLEITDEDHSGVVAPKSIAWSFMIRWLDGFRVAKPGVTL